MSPSHSSHRGPSRDSHDGRATSPTASPRSRATASVRRSWTRRGACVDAAGARFGFTIEWSEFLVGGAAIDAYGVAIRPEDVLACGAADAILLGAVGGPKWSDPSATVRPEQALFALRGGLGLFANLRPVSVHPALAAASPLRPELLDGVDMLIVRELTGGVYFGDRREATGDGPDARRSIPCRTRSRRSGASSSWRSSWPPGVVVT